MGLNSSTEEDEPNKKNVSGKDSKENSQQKDNTSMPIITETNKTKEEIKQNLEEGNKARTIFRRFINLLVRAVWGEKAALTDLSTIIVEDQRIML